MSVKPEERIKLKNRESKDLYQDSEVNLGSNNREFCNLNIATFTFGGRGNSMNSCQLMTSGENQSKNVSECNEVKNNYRKYNPSEEKGMRKRESKECFVEFKENKEFRDLPLTETRITNTNSCKTDKNPKNYATTTPHPPTLFLSTILNPLGSHSSFLSVVIHSMWNLKYLRNFIINEISLSEGDSKNRLLLELKSVFLKYSQNKKIDVIKLRTLLADLFQNRRKFLIEQPDDPIDCFFAFLNAIHSYSMKNSLNEVFDTMCSAKCPSHRDFWIDLCRVDECECKGNSKRFYSNHNYIFDIPLDKLFELSNNMNLIEMSKSFKLKSGKFSEINKNEVLSISDLKGKLFLYYKLLLNVIKVECPAKGIRCEVNRTSKSFFLSNFPSYLTFSLQKYNSSCFYTVTEILKTFILIPKIFDLGTLFNHSSKQKIFFEFLGAILLKPGKTYSCFFKNRDINMWLHYDDEKITTYSSWFELLSECIKNCEFPILIFFQIQEKFSEEKDLTPEELQLLERHARNADNLQNIIVNRFRSNEDIIKFENLKNNSQQHSSKGSETSVTSKNLSNNNSNSRLEQVTEYSCIGCLSKNRIECPVCLKCNKNNEAQIEDLLKKRGMNYINIANFNLNINTSGVEVKNKDEEKFSSLNSKKANPFSEKNIKKIVEDEDSETDFDRASNVRHKYYNMPMQIKKKENPVMIKNINIENAHNKPSNNYKPDIIPDKLSRPSKKTLTIEERTNNYEDRAQPYEMARSKSRKSMSAVNNKAAMPESWFCETCKKINKPYEYKCQDCRKINTTQREILETLITSGSDHRSKPSLQINPTTVNLVKSPEKRTSTAPSIERKNSEKKILVNNYHSNQEIIKKNCLCFSNNSQKVIKNNICTLCNRYIEDNTHENSMKKRSQDQNVHSHQRNSLNSQNAFNSKKPDPRISDPKLKKDDSSTNLHKFRSPSTNVLPAKQRATTFNKHKDIFIEDEEVTNPFAKKPSDKEKSTISSAAQNSNRIQSSHSSNRKKTESVQLSSNHSSSLTKNRKN